MEGDADGCERAQRGAQSLSPAGTRHLQAVKRLPPQKLGCRPRCTASGVRASGSWRARLSVRWRSCMCVWHCSTPDATRAPDHGARGAMAWLRLGLGSSRFAFVLCNKAHWHPHRVPEEVFARRLPSSGRQSSLTSTYPRPALCCTDLARLQSASSQNRSSCAVKASRSSKYGKAPPATV